MRGSQASPTTPGSRACEATPGSPDSSASLVSPDSPATPGSRASPATPGSQACPATPGSRACPATPGSRASPATSGSGACPATPGSRTCPATSGSGACPATPVSGASPASPGSGAFSATQGSGASPATSGSGACPATPGLVASPATLGSGASPASPGSRACPASPGSGASSATQGSGASPATRGSRASPATPRSRASSVSLAAQAPLTFPSSSLLYSQVSRIIASRKQRAGIWFPHLGLIEKTPESTTMAMMKQPFLLESKRKVEERVPLCYQLRQQQANKSNFPFSMHDNRRGLEFCGHGLDECLGRKKLEQTQLHFHPANFNSWASDYVPTPEDSISTYQASFVAKSRARGLYFPLYPKHHSDRWNGFLFYEKEDTSDESLLGSLAHFPSNSTSGDFFHPFM